MTPRSSHSSSRRTTLVSVALLSLGFVIATPAAAADDPKFVFAKPTEVKTVEWKATAQAGFVLTTGNANQATFSGGFMGLRNDGKNKLQLDLNGAYAEATILTPVDLNGNGKVDGTNEISNQRKVTAGNFLGKLRYDRFFTKNNALYLAVYAGLDVPASKEVFVGAQVGYSRQLLKTNMHELLAELGYDFSYVQYVVPVDSSVMLHSGRAFVGYGLTLSENTNISASVEALINLNPVTIGGVDRSVAEATRVNGKVALTTKLWKNLSFRAAFSMRYDNSPSLRPALSLPYGPDFKLFAEKLDTMTEIGLIVNFL